MGDDRAGEEMPASSNSDPETRPASKDAAKLLEKKKEFESIQALEKASAQFLKRIEALGNDFDVMADAGTGE